MKKVLIIIGIIIAAVILIPLIVALFTKKEYRVVKEVTINQPIEEVFDYILMLKNQDEFSVWSKIDPKMKSEYRGTDGTVGFVSAWESDNPDVGKGEQEITRIEPGARIDYELRFLEPFESTSLAFMTTESLSETSTLVKWGFSGEMKYPMNLMLVVMDFEGMIGNDLQSGLNNLKIILENQ
ncbi:MAG: SRPBCC family protein [Bacteroidales bacterium]|nr:SRPBCC family protein [Bacteroidales bacterium]